MGRVVRGRLEKRLLQDIQGALKSRRSMLATGYFTFTPSNSKWRRVFNRLVAKGVIIYEPRGAQHEYKLAPEYSAI